MRVLTSLYGTTIKAIYFRNTAYHDVCIVLYNYASIATMWMQDIVGWVWASYIMVWKCCWVWARST